MIWESKNGPIPNGLFVLHKCDVRSCVNPDHLFLGTPKDNALDMVQKKRHRADKITHCPEGHPYSGENLWTSKAGGRLCLICCAARSKKSLEASPAVKNRAREYNRRYHEANSKKISARKRAAYRAKRNILTRKESAANLLYTDNPLADPKLKVSAATSGNVKPVKG